MKRGGYIERKTPLRRSGRIKVKPPRRLSRPGADRDYVAWLHNQPCIGEEQFRSHNCETTRWCNPIEQSHDRNMTGLGRKEPDRNSVPMCRVLHRQWEENRVNFAGWSKEKRHAWMAERIIEANAAYELTGGVLR